jgi:hypothetical protein
MIIKNEDFNLSVNIDKRLGIISQPEENPDEDFPDIERQPIKITKVNKEKSSLNLEWEEITEEEFHQLRHNSEYVEDIAEKVEDELDTEMLLKDAIADLDKGTRKKVKEKLEDDEEDVEVENQSGCHELKVGGETIVVR